MSRVVIDSGAVNQLMRSPQGPVIRQALVVANQIRSVAKQKVGVDTGDLRDSIVARIDPGLPGAVVGTFSGRPLAYARYHHDGSRAVSGKLMVFKVGNKTVFATKRKAIPPNRYLLDAAQSLGLSVRRK